MATSDDRGPTIRPGLPGVFLAAAVPAALLLAPPHAAAQEEAGAGEPPATLFGTVRSAGSGEPVKGVEIRILPEEIRVTSDADGNFRIGEVPPGESRLVLRYLGGESGEIPVTLDAGADEELHVEVYGKVVRGGELRVEVTRPRGERSPGMAGFWDRQAQGQGTFITPEEIRGHGGQRLADVFRGRMGIEIHECTESPSDECFGFRSSHRQCSPDLFLDGALVSTAGPGASVLTDLPVQWVKAIEIYPGPAETPPEFRGVDAACGAVVVWTRTGSGASS